MFGGGRRGLLLTAQSGCDHLVIDARIAVQLQHSDRSGGFLISLLRGLPYCLPGTSLGESFRVSCARWELMLP